MDADERAFLEAILTHPADDVARLVYADWLEERGGRPEWAEFVRVQCEIAKWSARLPDAMEAARQVASMGFDLDPTCLAGMCHRSLELFRAYAPKWFNDLLGDDRGTHADGTIHAASGWKYEFGRGFLDSVECTAADWLANADALFWSPAQTVECPTCAGIVRGDCLQCGGSGRVPRPFVPTAHPIEKVTLTTHSGLPFGSLANVEVLNYFRVSTGLEDVEPFLPNPGGTHSNALWPGIAFTLALPA